MLFDCALRSNTIRLAILGVFGISLAAAATFGRVVPIGGEASDIALDESRGVLYIANFAQNRIDVMSVADYNISRSLSVAPYPGSLALSPDNRYLVITHYAYTNGAPLSPPGANAVTIIDLSDQNRRRLVGLSSAPLGVAFGSDNLAVILTQTEVLLLDPGSGIAQSLAPVANFNSQVLPAPLACFSPQIITGALTASGDGQHIFGVAGGTCSNSSTSSGSSNGSSSVLLRFSYNVPKHDVDIQLLSTAPPLGPRVISASSDGLYYMAGWALITCRFSGTTTCGPDSGPLLAEWPNSSGILNVGSVAIRSSTNRIYAQLTPVGAAPPPAGSTLCYPNGRCINYADSGSTASGTLPPALMVLDSDNLTVRERIQIPENLAGRSVFNSDESIMYSISDSGVTVFPMVALDQAPRLAASAEDIVFRGDFCNGRAPITQTIDIVDLGGNATPFQIAPKAGASCPAVSLSASSGVTPATITITIPQSQLGSFTGTRSCTLEISSPVAVNMPSPPARGVVETDYKSNVRARFRLLFNNQAPENRGAFFNAPGQLVDVLPDPSRNRFYVLRQDKNEVQVYDSSTYQLLTRLRTSNTPTQMAITTDQRVLMVAHDDSQLAFRYDLNSLQTLDPIIFPLGHYPRSIAASVNGILAVSRIVGGSTGQNSQNGRIDEVHAPFPVSPTGAYTGITLASLGPWENKISASTTLIASPSGATILAASSDGHLMLYSASSGTFSVARKDFASLSGAYAAANSGVYMVDHYLLNQSLVKVATVMPGADFSSGYAFMGQDGVAAAVYPTSDAHPSLNGYVQRLSMAAGVRPLPTAVVEAPMLRPGDTEFPFTRTVAPMADGSAFILLTTSGFTVLPWDFDAATSTPALDRVVNAADFTGAIASGGLITTFGSQLSPLSLSSSGAPLPTGLGGSCLTVNGAPVPMLFISPTQINAQLPTQMTGPADIVLHTPAGASDILHVNISPAAPAIFQSGAAGPMTGIPTVFRASNQVLVTNSNPVHMNDTLTVYLTGMGATAPAVEAGIPAPSNQLARTVMPATVTLGGVPLSVQFAGLAPGFAGVYQVNALVPFKGVPAGFNVPLVISQGGASTSVPVRVVE